MTTNLIDYGKLNDGKLVGVESDGTNYDFVVKSSRDSFGVTNTLGSISFARVSIETQGGAERSTLCEAFHRALTTPNVLTAETKSKLRAHRGWGAVRDLVNRETSAELQLN